VGIEGGLRIATNLAKGSEKCLFLAVTSHIFPYLNFLQPSLFEMALAIIWLTANAR